MIVTTSQLRGNQKEYLDLSSREDIYVARNGKIIAKIVNPYADKLATLRSLKGSIPLDMTEKEIQEERTENL